MKKRTTTRPAIGDKVRVQHDYIGAGEAREGIVVSLLSTMFVYLVGGKGPGECVQYNGTWEVIEDEREEGEDVEVHGTGDEPS